MDTYISLVTERVKIGQNRMYDRSNVLSLQFCFSYADTITRRGILSRTKQFVLSIHGLSESSWGRVRWGEGGKRARTHTQGGKCAHTQGCTHVCVYELGREGRLTSYILSRNMPLMVTTRDTSHFEMSANTQRTECLQTWYSCWLLSPCPTLRCRC